MLLLPILIFAEKRDSGPLYGKTFYIPFSIYLQGPESRAKSAAKGTFSYYAGTYYLNDNKVLKEGSNYYALRDYESCIQEVFLNYTPITNLKLSTVLRVQEVYGGFMDPIIEGFHSLFKFPNGGREYIPQNSVSINIENNNGVRLESSAASAAFCDIEIWGQYTFFTRDWIDLAGVLGFKIPSGVLSGESIYSSGYVDLNLTLLADFYAGRLFSFYVQTGLTIPMDSLMPQTASSPYPFFAGKLAVEFHPWDIFSFIVQMNIKSPAITGGIEHWYFDNVNMLDLPQTNLLVGFTFHMDNFRWQFYFEEDIITNQGNDILLNISFTQQIPLIKP